MPVPFLKSSCNPSSWPFDVVHARGPRKLRAAMPFSSGLNARTRRQKSRRPCAYAAATPRSRPKGLPFPHGNKTAPGLLPSGRLLPKRADSPAAQRRPRPFCGLRHGRDRHYRNCRGRLRHCRNRHGWRRGMVVAGPGSCSLFLPALPSSFYNATRRTKKAALRQPPPVPRNLMCHHVPS